MIEFKVETTVKSYNDFVAYCEVYNAHVDEIIEQHPYGMLYATKAMFANKPSKVITYRILDMVKGNLWMIYDTDGPCEEGTEKYQRLLNYVKEQYKRLQRMYEK